MLQREGGVSRQRAGACSAAAMRPAGVIQFGAAGRLRAEASPYSAAANLLHLVQLQPLLQHVHDRAEILLHSHRRVGVPARNQSASAHTHQHAHPTQNTYLQDMPSMVCVWYATLLCVNFSPCAVDTTTVRSSGPMTPRARSFISAASATPCTQTRQHTLISSITPPTQPVPCAGS